MTYDEARSLTQKILASAKAGEVELRLELARSAHLRFARNAATTSGATQQTTASVTAWKGKRKASVSATIGLAEGGAEAALKKLVAEAEELAALSPEDPEYLPLLGPQSYLEVKAYDRATAELPAAARARAAGDALRLSRRRNVMAAGFFQNRGVVHVLANSAGLFAYFPISSAFFSVTARTPDGAGSGYAAVSSVAMQNLDCREAAAIAARKALESRGARELAPGDYPTILEPQALADLFPSFQFFFNARSADEGRSVFSALGGKTRIGEKIFDSRVNLYTDPQNSTVPAASFGEDGYRSDRAYLARNGILENLAHSRYWASRKGRPPGPFLVNLIMDGEGKSLAEMIASTERGVLLTHLWYIRAVDPQQGLVTGLTRDGTFYIEGGKIMHPIKNFRFNESLVRVLAQIDSLGTPQRVTGIERGNYPMLLPALKVKSFRFTSISDAV